jgi:hypothetical protein
MQREADRNFNYYDPGNSNLPPGVTDRDFSTGDEFKSEPPPPIPVQEWNEEDRIKRLNEMLERKKSGR